MSQLKKTKPAALRTQLFADENTDKDCLEKANFTQVQTLKVLNRNREEVIH